MKAAPFKTAVLALAMLGLAGCASGPQRNPEDPLEPFNRSMFALNEGLDKAVAKPVAQGYQTLTPYPVRLHVSNFFNNLEDGWTVINNALQLRPKAFAESFMRFNFNTFLGMGGLVNVADSMGLAREQQDFGKTLGRWGVPPGPYVVLPVLGASTVRDTAALGIDSKGALLRKEAGHIPSRNSLYALRLVDKRANLLVAGNLLEEAALDKYAFMRNAYMQKRQSEIDTLRHQKAVDDDYYDSLPDDAPPNASDDAAQTATQTATQTAAQTAATPGSQAWLYEAPASVSTSAAAPVVIASGQHRSNAAMQAPNARLLNR
jgi:phospholipid-binding lipoprotein MlaA